MVSARVPSHFKWPLLSSSVQQYRGWLAPSSDVKLVPGVNGLTRNVAGSQTSYLASSLFVSLTLEFVLEALVTNLTQIHRSLSFCLYTLPSSVCFHLPTDSNTDKQYQHTPTSTQPHTTVPTYTHKYTTTHSSTNIHPQVHNHTQQYQHTPTRTQSQAAEPTDTYA